MTREQLAGPMPRPPGITSAYTPLPPDWDAGVLLGGSAQISVREFNLVWYGGRSPSTHGSAEVRLLGRSPFTALIHAVDGECEIRAGSRRMSADRSTIAIIRSGEEVDARHLGGTGGRMGFRYLEIGAYMWDGVDVFRLLTPPAQLAGNDARYVTAAMARLVDAEGEPNAIVRTARRSEIGHAVVAFLAARSTPVPWADDAMDAVGRLGPLLRRIDAHLDDEYDIERLTRLAGMSRSALHRQFAAALGTAPLTYIRNRRLDAAAADLVRTTDTLETIAGRARFAGSAHLIRAFKERYGVTPGEYRRRRDGRTPS